MVTVKVKKKDQNNNLNKDVKDIKLTDSIDQNVTTLQDLFKDVGTLITRNIEKNVNEPCECQSSSASSSSDNSDSRENDKSSQKEIEKPESVNNKNNKDMGSDSSNNKNQQPPRYFIAYIDGMVDNTMVNDFVVRPLMHIDPSNPKISQIDYIINSVLLINEVKKTDNFKDIVESITYGDTILFIEGESEAIILNTKGFMVRSIEEPDGEKVLSGPKEGFNETMLFNLSMIQRRVRSNDLKIKFMSFGKQTHTQACICYIDSVVNKQILKDLTKRLEGISIDGMLDINYITELIKDSPFSPFKTVGFTERPDVVVGKILEGRIAVFLDGTPVVLTLPFLFVENFHSNEDYYLNYLYGTFSRILRIIGFLLTVIVPGLYVAIEAFHQEMIPPQLLVNVALERQSVPFPAAVEIFILLVVFDMLKETGVRMPTSIGQAMSIVGALVIGQAAVEAKLVAAPTIIVVALTGITGLLTPQLNTADIILRYFLLFLGSCFGLYGIIIGISLVIIHLLNLKSFGVSQFIPVKNLQFQEIKDIVIRAPWWKMKTRPSYFTGNRTRMKLDGDQNKS